MTPRVIPVLLMQDGRLVKTEGFLNPSYVGDPINTARIFNDLQADELFLLDITASKPDLGRIRDVVSECFMPVAYGGGISTLEDLHSLFRAGVEKVCLNRALESGAGFVREAVQTFGSQAVVAALDVRRGVGGYRCCVDRGRRFLPGSLEDWLEIVQGWGIGEILLSSIDQDGRRQGYDLNLIRAAGALVKVPLIALGGAGKYSDFREALASGATAVAAGSFFVHHGPHRAVLVQYPPADLRSQL